MSGVDNSPRAATVEIGGVPVGDLPRSLRRRAAELRLAATRPRRSAAKLAVIVAVAVGAGALAVVLDNPLMWAVYAVVAGIVLTSLFAVEHEALHTSLFGHPFADHVVGTLCGVVCLTPYAAYRPFHFEHHIRTHVEGDPEPIVVVRGHLSHLGMVAFGVLGLAAMLWAQLLSMLVGRGPAFARRSRRHALEWTSLVAGLALPVACVVTGLFAGWRLPLLLWAAPLAVFLPLAGFVSTTEHYGCEYGPAPAVRTSRTVRTNAAARWLLWNANFHTAHHVLPGVPAHNLATLHELIEPDCEYVADSYVGWHLQMARRIRAGDYVDPPPWDGSDEPADLSDAGRDDRMSTSTSRMGSTGTSRRSMDPVAQSKNSG
ncbi:MAG: hypothetical protein GY812_06530 [Actinomycetia bacterium]|nr:hypothetical protein [Actinomycetes bacterium]